MGVVDRCTTCHQGIAQPSSAGRVRAAAFPRASADPSPRSGLGCVGLPSRPGRATEVAEAHETTLAWEQPLLPDHFIQASCGTCHRDDLPETPQLNRGRQLLAQSQLRGLPSPARHRPAGDARAGSDQYRHEGQPRNGFTSG